VAAVIAEGKSVTYDMKPNRDDPTAVGTSQMADAIIRELEKGSTQHTAHSAQLG
jgi:isocitrate dehydrogenase (NAD+)